VNLEDEIRSVLFDIGKDIQVHKLIDGNLIIDIDYDKYVDAIIEVINKKG